MNNPTRKRKRKAFRPSVIDASLEGRLVLSGATAATAESAARPLITVMTPGTQPGVTPAPAAPPVSARVALARINHPLSVAHLRAAYRQQVRAAIKDLGTAIQADVSQLRAGGSNPTAQQLA